MAKLFETDTYKDIKTFINHVDLNQVYATIGMNEDEDEFDINIVVTYNNYGVTESAFFTESTYDNPDEAMKRAKTIIRNFTKAYPKAVVIQEVEIED